MVDLVPGASIVGEPCNKVALLVLEASAGHHKAVRRRDIYQTVPSGPDLAFQSPATISMSPLGTLPTASWVSKGRYARAG